MDKTKLKIGEYYNIYVAGGYNYSGQVVEIYDEMFVLGDYTIYFDEVEAVNNKVVDGHELKKETEKNDILLIFKCSIVMCAMLAVLNMILSITSDTKMGAVKSGLTALFLFIVVVINIGVYKKGSR